MRNWIILLCLFLMSPSANAQDIDRRDDLRIWMPNSSECDAPDSGPGSSREQPAETSIATLLAHARSRHENGTVDGLINCQWVRVSGHFRAIEYWHYAGRLHPSPEAIYSGSRDSLLIESFANETPSKFMLNGTNFELVGFFYDLCFEAQNIESDAEANGIALMNMGGPCHYGNLEGLMIQNAEIVQQDVLEPVYFRGEVNRGLIGNVQVLSSSTAAYQNALDQTQAWLDSIIFDEYEWLTSRNFGDEILQMWLEDPNDWSSFITDPEQSPIRNLGSLTASNFRALQSSQHFLYRNRMEREDHYFEYGCVCTANDCENIWPLYSVDLEPGFPDHFICLSTGHRREITAIE
ncbi:hypothetical protein HXX25_07825 [Hyphobacterium sp. CCMP332]|uniref:hypothetical protein n=1 Tax=Hyphobacterium sp. CCMP332 TaxID=2749086 RepID=UPI00164F45E5|nr:hypothetical protein [Hyphobacterium sp. CCMP332]QNL19227.1 hypothetical protein HXX25_07825 [Hyphobacterium sp. CCMP332]